MAQYLCKRWWCKANNRDWNHDFEAEAPAFWVLLLIQIMCLWSTDQVGVKYLQVFCCCLFVLTQLNQTAYGDPQSAQRKNLNIFQVFWTISYKDVLTWITHISLEENWGKPLGQGTCWFFVAPVIQTCLNDLHFHWMKGKRKEKTVFCFRLLFLNSQRAVLLWY